MGYRKAAHHRGSHQRRAKAVTDAAYMDPDTPCQRCGLTLDMHPPHATWDAGHVVDGQVGGDLAPEASTCNRSAGAALGNRRRRPLIVSREW